MKTILAVVVIALLVSPAMAGYYVAGDFNGWNPGGNVMTDNGGGIWSVDLTGLATGRHEFKVTVGDWSSSWPNSGNSWLFTDGSGNISITYDTNTYSDGWLGTSQRIGLNVDPATWTAVGDWQGWSNSNPATAMASLGGGIYYYQQVIAPGSYMYKAVVTGSWDAIGADARSVNADNASFTTTASDPIARFWVNALTGAIKVDVVPEPSALFVLATGLVGAAGLIRRKS